MLTPAKFVPDEPPKMAVPKMSSPALREYWLPSVKEYFWYRVTGGSCARVIFKLITSDCGGIMPPVNATHPPYSYVLESRTLESVYIVDGVDIYTRELQYKVF